MVLSPNYIYGVYFISPDMPVKLEGSPEVITDYDWIVAKATHKPDGRVGYLTSLKLENKAAATDHASVDDGDDIDTQETDETQQPDTLAQTT